jgi:hypothetical protein
VTSPCAPWLAWVVDEIGVDYFSSVVRVSLAQIGGDDHLSAVALLPGPQELVLSDARVTDAGLARQGGLTQLWHLNLTETEVTDVGLKSFAANDRPPGRRTQR